MRWLTCCFLAGVAIIVATFFAPPLVEFCIGVAALFSALLWAVCLVGAGEAREVVRARENVRERADERAAQDRLYGRVR